jgi:hypothetical protein
LTVAAGALDIAGDTALLDQRGTLDRDSGIVVGRTTFDVAGRVCDADEVWHEGLFEEMSRKDAKTQ